MAFSDAQTRALAHVGSRAERGRAPARARMEEILRAAGERQPAPVIDALIERVRAHGTVTLSFHPDRLLRDGRTVAEGLLHEGRYRNQFETGVTSGSRTAFAGGDRDGWEQKLFGDAYHQPESPFEQRPKYGALNLMQHVDGGSPRFGSCYFELRSHMTERCTLTWGDSHAGPAHVGTVAVLEPVLAALLDSAEMSGEALGSAIDVKGLLRVLSSLERGGRGGCGRALDAYIEAQVHADIDLSADASALVIDPSFRGTPTGELLEELCAAHEVAVAHHPGFVLSAGEVPDDFRGPRMAPLAARVVGAFASVPGRLDAATIGRAAQSLQRERESWRDWATFEETLQHIKQLWHVLVKYGAPLPLRVG